MDRGTPCVDWSSNGKRRELQGAALIAFIAWIAQRLLLAEPAILHENVPRFPVELLILLFGEINHDLCR